MILSLFRKKADAAQVHAVYGAIVAQSRRPLFYARWQVPDTVTGRFYMISLHLCLVLRRIKNQPEAGKDFSQALFDLFFADMDRSLREMGAGDVAVPKRIQKMGELFYGLLASLVAALDGKDEGELRATLSRNIFEAKEPDCLNQLAAYVLAQAENLDNQPVAAIAAGKIDLDLGLDPTGAPQK